jgi:hypothetical protein
MMRGTTNIKFRQNFLVAAYKSGILIKEPKGLAFVTVIHILQVLDS